MQTRRRFLVGSSAGLAIGLAGCRGSRGTDGIELDRLDVGGSPGGTVRVAPPGEVVLLDFWATWCAPCKPQMAELRTVHERYPDLYMLSITNETDRDAVRSFWTEYEGTWSVAVDPDLRTNERYDVARIPTLLVLDTDGETAWRHTGLAAADTIGEALERAGV